MFQIKKIYDSHIHVGNLDFFKNLIENSQYKNRYRMYDFINYELFDFLHHKHYINGGIVMPMLTKDLSSSEFNNKLKNFRIDEKFFHKCYLIDEKNPNCKGYENSKLFKEHFLLHKFVDFENRLACYDYINNQKGLIIIHAKDETRIDEINKITKLFKNITIIIAHLGRDVYSNESFIKNVLETFKNNKNIYVDTSTIIDPKIITLACKSFNENRILFGTDIPFAEGTKKEYFNNTLNSILKAEINDNVKEKILYKNYERLMDKIFNKNLENIYE